MKYHKLRIAWSVGWGTLAVLVCVISMRSYWWLENVNFSTTGTTVMQSFDGGIAFLYSGTASSPGITSASAKELRPMLVLQDNIPKWYFGSNRTGVTVRCPHWFVTLLLGILTALPWIRWRFSLRTLLIATTLIALALGTIIATTR